MDTALNGAPEADASAFSEGKGFGIRALAYIIDQAILVGMGQVLGFLAGLFIATGLLIIMGEVPPLNDEITFSWVGFVFGLVELVIYYTLFEGLFGASPGKLITGLRVVQEDGSPCGLKPAFKRGIWRYIDGLFFGIVAYSSMKKTPLNQRNGDTSAKTVVVGASDPGIKETRDWVWFIVAAAAFTVISGLFSLVTIVTFYL